MKALLIKKTKRQTIKEMKGNGKRMRKLIINPEKKQSKISKEIYGHFSEHLGRGIYEGLFVGEDSPIENVNGMRSDVVEALKNIKVPVLRWPGGCFADEYHWMDGIGPKEGRKKMINTHWGGVVEDNSFGTHEFFELCEQLGCEAYINGNLGSGTVREMSEWVEYMTFDGVSPMAKLREENGHKAPWKVDFFGVGNENWGCGGNMNPDFYANEYRRYQTYVRNYSKDYTINKICCGANVDDTEWTKGVLGTCYNHTPKDAHGLMDGLSLHYYVHTYGWEHKGSATDFDEKDWYQTIMKTMYMEDLIKKHGTIMDEYDPEKKIGMIVDEWGTWHDCEPGTNPGFLYQQNTIRDALVAGITLNIFNKHSDRIKMANIAQMINVLQAVILTDGEKMIKTPTYHIFDMYKVHHDAELVESSIESSQIGICDDVQVQDLTESVSIGEDGILNITVTNASCEKAVEVETILTDKKVTSAVGEIVTGQMREKNTFEEPDEVEIKSFDDFKIVNGVLTFTIPACSVLHLAVTR